MTWPWLPEMFAVQAVPLVGALLFGVLFGVLLVLELPPPQPASKRPAAQTPRLPRMNDRRVVFMGARPAVSMPDCSCPFGLPHLAPGSNDFVAKFPGLRSWPPIACLR